MRRLRLTESPVRTELLSTLPTRRAVHLTHFRRLDWRICRLPCTQIMEAIRIVRAQSQGGGREAVLFGPSQDSAAGSVLCDGRCRFRGRLWAGFCVPLKSVAWWFPSNHVATQTVRNVECHFHKVAAVPARKQCPSNDTAGTSFSQAESLH